MKKGRPKGVIGKARVLTKAQIQVIISEAKRPENGGRHCHRNSTILAVSYYLGLRAKELSGLNMRDVLGSNNLVLDSINLTVTKSNKPRTIYIPKILQRILHDFITTHNRISCTDASPLFKSQKGSRFTPNTMQCLMKRIYLKCGYIGCSSHTGRRSFATNLIESGADIKAVSTLMGHSSISMTAQYVEDNPIRLSKMINVML